MWRVFRQPVAVVVAVALTWTCLATAKPNIVFILTDDQDYQLGSLDHMQVLQEQLVQQGTLFSKHYGHVSQCCPARATLWTGLHAHNTNITDVVNANPGGGYKHVQEFGWYKNYLPVWMQQAGYNTYYSGKIFNGYGIQTYCNPVCLEGWTKADILVDPRTYTYYNSTYVHYNGSDWSKPQRTNGYSTDQVTDYVVSYIDEAVKSEKPFMAIAAPIAPHNSRGPTYPNNSTKLPYPVPKKEYADLFQDLVMPKSPNFNPDNRTGVAGVWALEHLSESNCGYLDEYYRVRQRCLKSVDDMIEAIVQKLDDAGVLDNTYIFYSTDNGYHIGNHRLQPGKLQCFEEDINIPLIVRGPGVGKGQTLDLVTGHIDIAPTFLTLAGADINPNLELDGTAISFPLETESDFMRNLGTRGEITHLEFWGPFKQEGMFKLVGVNVNENLQIYKALRLQGNGYNLMYSVWCQDGAHELYDMTWDPYQMTNLHPAAPAENSTTNVYVQGMNTLLGRPTERVVSRLDALVLVQKTCKADICREPWLQLHPDGKVSTLMDALDEKYDGFYENAYSVGKVGWKQCYTGYHANHSSTLYDLDNEQPIWLNETVKTLVQSAGGRSYSCSKWTWGLSWLCLMSVFGYWPRWILGDILGFSTTCDSLDRRGR